MATRCSEDSGIFQPLFDFSAPSPPGYFDNLFTSPSPSVFHHRRLSNTASSIMSDLQKSDPEAFYQRIFGIADDGPLGSGSKSLSGSDDLHL
jgi:hypothetical protein